MQTVPARVLINHIGKFKYWKCVESVSRAPEDAYESIPTPDVVMSRDAAPLELFAAQKSILHTIANPFTNTSFAIVGRVPARFVNGLGWGGGGAGAEGGGAGAEDRIVRSNRILTARVYPIARILNMPTGTGKTVLSVVGLVTHLMDASVQERMKTHFKHYARAASFCGHGGGSVWLNTMQPTSESDMEHVFLPNAMLVHAPRHLVGAWRDTLVANFGTNDKVRIFPTSAALTLSALPVDEVRANPDVLFVFVTHEANIQKYLAVEEAIEDPGRVSSAPPGEVVTDVKSIMPACKTRIKTFHYGGAIFDEVDRFDLAIGLTHARIPPAMYNLLVTATPSALGASTLYRIFFTDRARVDDYDKGTGTSVLRASFIPTELSHNVPASRQLEMHLRMTHNMDHLAYLMSHNVLSLQLLVELQQQVSERIPAMHAYAFRTRMSIAQRLGLVDNDMGDPRAVQRKLEESFEVQLHGKGVAAVLTSLDKAIVKQRGVLAAANCPHEDPNEARAFPRAVVQNVEKLKRMLTLRRVLGECMNEPCGICMDERKGNLIFTSCCGFCACKDCHARIVTDRMSCPKCRLNGVRFASVHTGEAEAVVEPPAPKKRRARASAGAGAATAEAEPAAQAAPTGPVPKNKEAFEEWLAGFNPTHMSQQEAVQTVMARARANGITHVILAGPNVDTWELSTAGSASVEGFQIVRPANGRRTAMALDRSYAQFCSTAAGAAAAAGAGEEAAASSKLLMLDTVKNNHKELTGIDAKLTDLIIQVTDRGVDEAEYTQLIGRAMRIGRDGHAVHCLLH